MSILLFCINKKWQPVRGKPRPGAELQPRLSLSTSLRRNCPSSDPLPKLKS